MLPVTGVVEVNLLDTAFHDSTCPAVGVPISTSLCASMLIVFRSVPVTV